MAARILTVPHRETLESTIDFISNDTHASPSDSPRNSSPSCPWYVTHPRPSLHFFFIPETVDLAPGVVFLILYPCSRSPCLSSPACLLSLHPYRLSHTNKVNIFPSSLPHQNPPADCLYNPPTAVTHITAFLSLMHFNSINISPSASSVAINTACVLRKPLMSN